MDIYIKSKKYSTSSLTPIGKGGEAEIYDLGNGTALKVFKLPTHPDVRDSDQKKEAAKQRIAEHQTKLKSFPSGLPDSVIAPVDLAYDNNDRIMGYQMKLVDGADMLRKFSEPPFRSKGVTVQDVISIFIDMHKTVSALHKQNVVIGDFNDLNVLVCGGHYKPYFIDADSFQYGGFFCKTYTERFVDPLACDDKSSVPLLCRPYTEGSDWYAYAVLLMQSLLMLAGGPYGGVYMPQKKGLAVTHSARPMKRITVFNPGVIYPRPALPMKNMPDELLQFFRETFENDKRQEFPVALLLNMKAMPDGTFVTAAVVKETVEIKGKVKSTMIFKTDGVILFSAFQGGYLRWLYHENDSFKRENKEVVSKCSLSLGRQFSYAIKGDSTVLSHNGVIVEIPGGKSPVPGSPQPVEMYHGNTPSFGANENYTFWVEGGRLVRDHSYGSDYGSEKIGDVLRNQTLFWVGDKLGFGFYQAGEYNVSFVFETEHKGINDSVQLPRIPGQIVDTTCYFSSSHIWFMLSFTESGKTFNRCSVIDKNGKVLGSHQTQADDGSWLGGIRGGCAIGNFLLLATDDGIVRVDAKDGNIVETQRFPGTEKFVDSSSKLFPGKNGLYVVGTKEIREIQIT